MNAVALVGENYCLTGSSDKLVKVWDTRKLDAALHTISEHTGKVLCIESSEIGSKISFLSLSRPPPLFFVERIRKFGVLEINKYFCSEKIEENFSVFCFDFCFVLFLFDKPQICTGGADGVNVWNSTTFTQTPTLSLLRKDFEGEFVTCIAMDEESLAFGGLNGQIQYYDFTPHR